MSYVGDVITLDRGKNDSLDLFVEDAHKFEVRPLERSGYLAAEITEDVEIRMPPSMAALEAPSEGEDLDIDDDE